MSKIRFLPDDLPPVVFTDRDRTLHHQLEEAVRKYFYEACDGVTQGLLMSLGSEWTVLIQAEALILMISCPEQSIHWRVLNNIEPLGNILRQFSPTAKIRVCLSGFSETATEICINGISV
jgi:hypothetical protein